jgi:CO/xanthine dehydrogenase Mo-binding subunit
MFESFEYAPDGQLQDSTFVDYLVPTALDIPHMDTESMETPSLFAPRGIKGVGEGGGTPIAAIANAVEDALRPMSIEITESHQNPQRIFAAIAGKRGTKTQERTSPRKKGHTAGSRRRRR